MNTKTSGFTKFITFSFIAHIVFSVYLINYSAEYEAKAKLEAEEREKQENEEKEKEIKAELEEVLREIVDEKDEKKKEELVEELKDQIWEELKDKKEELVEEKKDLEKGQFIEKLADETLKALEELKKKQDEENKKKELLEELVNKDLPEVEKKIEEITKDKTVEQLQQEALKNTLAELKKNTEEEIKPIVEKTNDGFQKKIDELLKQLTEANKQDNNQTLEDQLKGILQKTDEITKKADEINNKYEANSEFFQKDELQEALEVYKDKLTAVDKNRETVLEVYNKLTEADKVKADMPKAPETNKDWAQALKNAENQSAAKNPENQTPISKPMAELSKAEVQKETAEKNLRDILNDEITDTKQVLEEIEKKQLTDADKQKIETAKKNLAQTEEKSKSTMPSELKSAAEQQQKTKNEIENLVKDTTKNNTSEDKSNIDKALTKLNENEKNVESKKTEVAYAMKKAETDSTNKDANKSESTENKIPSNEKEWQDLIQKSKSENSQSNPANNQTSNNNSSQSKSLVQKAIEELSKAEGERKESEKNLKEVLKTEINDAKKATAELEKSAKSEAAKKQTADVKQNLDKAEKQTQSQQSKEVKESAEIVKAAKTQLPEIAKNEQKNNENNDKSNKENKSTNQSNKTTEKLQDELKKTKELIEKAHESIADANKTEVVQNISQDKVEVQIEKIEVNLKNLKANNPEKKSPEEINNIAKTVEEAKQSFDKLKIDVAQKEQSLKKETEALRKNLTEKEKKEQKDSLAELDKSEKSAASAKNLELKIEALDQIEDKATEIKSNVNAERREDLKKNREEVSMLKDLSSEISSSLSSPSKESSEEARKDIIQSIEDQAMQSAIEEKTKNLESFLEENESEDANAAIEDFKQAAQNEISQARESKSKENSNKNSQKESSKESEANEIASDEASEEGENASEEETGDESESKGPKSKNKGKGKKGAKGKSKENSKGGESEDDKQNDSAVAKAIADKIANESAGEGKEKGKGPAGKKEKDQQGNGSGQRLDGGGKNATDIARNIMLRSEKQFKKATVTAEDEKRIFTENINEEAIRLPPMIKFAKATANGIPLENRIPSKEIYVKSDVKSASKKDVPKNPERERVKHEKYKKGNFNAIPFLQTKPVIDGKSNEWNLDKCWVKSDKRIAMGWRSDGIYFFGTIRDRTDKFETAPIDEISNTWWRFDGVELWVDMQNSKADDTNQFDCQQFAFWPALQGVRPQAELYELLWGKKAQGASFSERRKQIKSNQPLIASVEHSDRRGYDIEVFIPMDRLNNQGFFKGGQVMGFLYIINHGNLVEDSSLEFYKEGYDGYSTHPSSWGNIQLLGTDAKIEQINTDKKIMTERFVEVSTNLSLQVTDTDANQNPNVVDKLTIRVKNENNFEGKKSEETDWEDIQMTETGKDTGLFEGTITLTVAPSKPEDNAINAVAGDTLHAFYNDHIQIAGEYDEKINIKIKVVPPVANVQGKVKK